MDILELKKLLKEVISEELVEFKNLLHQNLNDNNTSEKLMSMKEAAEFLQITTVSLFKYIKEGDIKTYRVGKRRRFKKSDLEKYLSNVKNRTIRN